MNLPEMKHLSEDQRERIVKKYELMADAYCSLLKAASSFIDSKSKVPVLQSEKEASREKILQEYLKPGK